MDVDDDSLLIIFDSLNATELMVLSKIPQFSPVISMVLRQSFNQLTIVIKGARRENFNRFYGKYCFEQIISNNDALVIDYFPKAAEILRSFGHLIKKLEIRSFLGWSNENVEQILEIIKLHCSKTVKSIYFHSIGEDIYNKLTVAFEAVETVGLMSRSDNAKLISSEYGVNKLFPAIQNLYMDSYNNLESSQTDTTDYVMPHLTHIQRTDKSYDCILDETQFGNIVKNNPQITSILVRSVNLITSKLAPCTP